MNSFLARFVAVVAIVSLIANVLLFMRYSSSRPLVTVGKEVITKKQYQDELERQAGQQVMSKMVISRLVAQAAARDGVTPPASDVDKQISDIQRSSPQVLTPYNQDPAKMAEFRQELQTGLALENLRIKDVALSPTQVADYYAKNKMKFARPQQVQATTVVTQNPVDTATAIDLLKQKTPLDVLGRQPRIAVVGNNNYNPDLSGLSPGLRQQISGFVQKARVNDYKTFPDDPQHPKYYLTFWVTKSDPAMIPSLADIKKDVERQARLAHAPVADEEVARLYQAAKPTFNSDKYVAYFDALQKYPVSQGTDKKTASDR